jgi:hypothetical protein
MEDYGGYYNLCLKSLSDWVLVQVLKIFCCKKDNIEFNTPVDWSGRHSTPAGYSGQW